ncbi:MAG: glycosyltransferase family 4 protein [Candidatus Zixiibacteriota bacterium]
MRLLLLADGSSVHTQRYQAEMAGQGVEVILASLERGDTVDILLKKKSVSNSLNYFFVNRQIKDLVRKYSPDIINPHFASGYGFSTALSKVWKKYPVALHCLGSDILISPQKSIAHKRRIIYGLARSKMIFADSDYLADEINRLYKNSQISVIPWGVESEIADIYQSKIENRFKFSKPLRILVPRPHQKVYNNKFIIRALKDKINDKRIGLSFPDWGDFTDWFKKLANELCPDGLIDYYKFKPREEYITFLAGHDIYLSASISDSSPASLIEAMGAGLWPVAANIHGVREWLDNNNGNVFDLNEPESINRIFDKLLSSDFNPEKILTENHARVMETAIFSKNISETIEIMERLIANGK